MAAKKVQSKRQRAVAASDRPAREAVEEAPKAKRAARANGPAATRARPKAEAKPGKAAQPGKAAKPDKATKAARAKARDATRLMKDRFRMPAAEFERLRALKRRARELGAPARKCDLLRAGLALLERADDAALRAALAALAR